MADFYLLGNTTDSQMFGCVIKTENKTIVIDGGTYGDGKQLADFLNEKSNSHVDAWVFTHPHHDHIGSFINIRRSYPSITVDRLYYHFPDLSDEVQRPLARSEFEATLWEDVKEWDDRHPHHKVMPGECFEFDDVKIRVLRVYNPEIVGINESSSIYRIEGKRHSILILGDLSVRAENDLIDKCPLELLQADYTQMAHHGQWGVSRKFYEYIKPKRCIWPTPEWLWNNDRGNGFDTDIFHTVRTREWMDALGVTEHFVEKDGIQKIEI